MTNQSAIAKFWTLAAAGKSAALDIDNGFIYCRHTTSNDAARTEGNGTPPIPAPGAERIAVCVNGVVTHV
jgi:hypothetical protein